MTPGWARTVVGAVLLAGAFGAATLPPATAAVPAAPLVRGADPNARAAKAARPDLELVGQTAWVGADQRFDIQLRVDGVSAADIEVATTVFGRIPFRSRFVQTVEGEQLGSVLVHESAPLSSFPPAVDGVVTVTTTPPLAQAGVYPVRVELRDPSEADPLTTLMTHLVYAPGPPDGVPLKLAWLVPVDVSPVVGTTGAASISRPELTSLGAIGNALQSFPRVPATLVPVPDTLDALATRPVPDGDRPVLSSLVRAAADRPVVAGSYLPSDIDALLAADLRGEAAAQVQRGRARTTEILDRAPDKTTWVDSGPLGPGGIEWLMSRDVERFVLPEAALEPTRLRTTLTAPFELAVAGDRPVTAAADPGLAAHFDKAISPVVAAHRLLADLAVIYFDRPGGEGRAVVAQPPRSWRADSAFLEAFLSGLRSSPIISATTLDELFATTPPARAGGSPLVRRLRRDDAVALPAARSIAAARDRLDSFGTLLEPGNPRYGEFERMLFAAEGRDISLRRRAAYLRGLQTAISDELALVKIPESQSIRLTARAGEVPISILSRTGYPVRVVVRVESNTLDFPDGGERVTLLARETTIERLPIVARGSGAFPLEVRLTSPDGRLAVATSRFTIRSTAASWVGLVLSAGAGLFLAVWWARHIHGRRSGKLVPT